MAVACDRGSPSSGTPTDTLAAVEDRVEHLFSSIAAVAELPADRAVVLDGRQRLVYLVDFNSGSVSQLGRRGAGPGEYGTFLRGFFRGPGDTIWLVDASNGRFALIAPGGEMLPGIVLLSSGNLAFARTRDTTGHFYRSTVGEKTDVVLRIDPATGRADTVTTIAVKELEPPETKSRTAPDGTPVMDMMIMASPFQREDAWGALPDGSVIVVRYADYHAAVFARNGEQRVGKPIPFTPVPFAANDPEAYGEKLKPPFYSSLMDPPRVSPLGVLWLRRVTGNNTREEYDLFDDGPRLLGHVVLSDSVSLLAVGQRHVYVSRETDAGFRVERLTYPAGTGGRE
jgi:hypothetical protein